MPFPANQVKNHFHVFISLLIAICLAAVPEIASHHWEYNVSLLRLDRYHLSGHVICISQQLNSRQNVDFHGHSVESLLGSLVLSSIHSTIIITNTLINQARIYYVITNFYLIWANIFHYSDGIIVIKLHLSSALVSCNNNDIIHVITMTSSL